MVDFQSRESRSTDEEEPDAEATGDANGKPGKTDPDQEGQTGSARAETGADSLQGGEADLGVAVVRVDGSVSVEDDPALTTAIDLLEANGLAVSTREVLASDFDHVQQILGSLVVREDVDAICTLGAAGVGPDDVAVDAAEALFETSLPGFGELFRSLARKSIGTAVVRSRATAGLVDGVLVFCLPGTAEAARIGLEKIVIPEVHTVVQETRD